MAIGKPSLVLTDLHFYGAGTVNRARVAMKLVRPVFGAKATKRYYRTGELAFDHVLNVPASEEAWPEDALKLFFPDVFEVRHYGDEQGYRCCGIIWDHIRDDLFLLSMAPENWTRESKWKALHQLYCYEFDGSFANELFDNDKSQYDPTTDWDEAPFSDGSDDEFDDEPDTLNSELLLSDEYLSPADLRCGSSANMERSNSACIGGHIRDREVRANDVQEHVNYYDQFYDVPSGLSPKRRVGTKQPTEPEDN